MKPGPFRCRAISAQRLLPGFHHFCLPNRFQAQNALRQGIKATGAAAVVASAGVAVAGARPVAFSGAAAPRGARSGGAPDLPALTFTTALIGLNALLYGAQVLSKDALTIWGIKINSLILKGQLWRLVTPAFLHGNVMHLAVNCYSLYSLGPVVENVSGGRRLLAVYLAAALAGNVASFYGSAVPSLGASGAVFGVGGALAVYFYRNKELYGKRADFVLKQLWQTLLLNLVFGLTNPRIDNWGHLGGLAGGAAAAWLLGPRLKLGSIQGQRGQFLLDVPPVGLLASPPRQIKR